MSTVHPHSDIPTVTADQLPEGAVLLDVREDDEWAAGHIQGALHVPMNSIPQRLASEPDLFHPDGGLVIVCKVGGRSAQVTAWLQMQGVDALNLQGGVLEWTGSGRPLVREDDGEPFVY
ncbi:MAG: Rhodanese domain protein [Pseudonocardiales bacterium]|nr:Rhodanese domain protein [Pseudonocardiales bacterium]